jgi:transcriptional regulator with XRE-family HTH domain
MAGLPCLPFATLLKRYRLAAGLTQEELAEQARVSARAISALERGVNRRPHRDTLRLLADALGLTGEERAGFEAAARSRTSAAWADGATPLPPTNLPDHPTQFIGRAGEIEAVSEILRRAKETAGKAPVEALKERLRDKQLLLVLDNLERLLQTTPLVGDLLAACTKLEVLVTSRAVLHLSAEHDFEVPPLSTDSSHLPPVDTLSQYDAVALFVDLAVAAKSDFAHRRGLTRRERKAMRRGPYVAT